MSQTNYKSEIRDSIIRDLLQKTQRGDHAKYLSAIRLERIRFFRGAKIRFDFPVTALIGPNGSGKSTILSAAACAYTAIAPKNIFIKSRVGDDQMNNWVIEYEIIDKSINPRGTEKVFLKFEADSWTRENEFTREVKFFSINRTVPATESPLFQLRKRLRMDSLTDNKNAVLSFSPVEDINSIIAEAEKILGKSLANFTLHEATLVRFGIAGPNMVDDPSCFIINSNGNIIHGFKVIPQGKQPKRGISQKIFVGGDGEFRYSEFNFGSGEASIIRMVADIETLPPAGLCPFEINARAG